MIPDPYGKVYDIPDRSRFKEILHQCVIASRRNVMAKCGTTEDILEALKQLGELERYFLLQELPRSASLQTVADVYNNVDKGESIAWLFRKDLTKSAIMSLSRGSSREKALQKLFASGLTTSMHRDPIRLARVHDRRGFFTLDINSNDLVDLISAVGHEKVMCRGGRWEGLLGATLETFAPELIR